MLLRRRKALLLFLVILVHLPDDIKVNNGDAHEKKAVYKVTYAVSKGNSVVNQTQDEKSEVSEESLRVQALWLMLQSL